MSNSLALRRRTFLNFSLLGAAVSAALPVKAFSQETAANISFLAPTAENPIRINFNENALGMSPSAQAAARDAVAKGNRYAKAEITQLHGKLCDMYKVPKNFLLLTDGSSEGIRALMGAYSRLPKVQLVIPELTYGDGEHFANLYNVPVVKVPMLADWKVDVAGLKTASPLFISSTPTTRRRLLHLPLKSNLGSRVNRTIPCLSRMRPMRSMSAIRNSNRWQV